MDAAVDESAHLLGVRLAHLIERHRPEAGIVHVRRQAQSAIQRPDRPGDEAGLVGGAIRELVREPASEARGFVVELVSERLQGVVGLGDPGGAERVRLQDVGARLEVVAVHLPDDVGPGEDEEIGVPLELPGMLGEALPPVVSFGEAVALEGGPHRAIDDQDALLGEGLDACGDVVRCHDRELLLPAARRGRAMGRLAEGQGHHTVGTAVYTFSCTERTRKTAFSAREPSLPRAERELTCVAATAPARRREASASLLTRRAERARNAPWTPKPGIASPAPSKTTTCSCS